MKKMVALLLVVCVMCSMLIVTAYAAELNGAFREEKVTTSAANVRKYPNTNCMVYGNLMKGETWLTSTPDSEAWFHGVAGLDTAFYQEFGDLDGYVASSNFGY